MASESSPASLSAFLEHLLPLFTSITTTRPDQDEPLALPDRILLINPLTQRMVVIGAGSTDISDPTKNAQPPASQASIDALPYTEIKCTEDINNNLGGVCECVICLDEWKVGDVVSEMPCKHKFHGGCVKKWLKGHGSCPVCRFKMPSDDLEKKNAGGSAGSGGYAWVTLAVGRASSDEDSLSMEG